MIDAWIVSDYYWIKCEQRSSAGRYIFDSTLYNNPFMMPCQHSFSVLSLFNHITSAEIKWHTSNEIRFLILLNWQYKTKIVSHCNQRKFQVWTQSIDAKHCIWITLGNQVSSGRIEVRLKCIEFTHFQVKLRIYQRQLSAWDIESMLVI